MRKKIKLSLGPGIEVEEIELRDGRWVLSARAAGERSCPVCGKPSTSRHGWHHRRLQDLPVQGTPLVLDLRLGRWRCLNERCSRKTFLERLPSVAAPMARRTVRVSEIVRLFGYAAGGLPSERLLARLAMPISDNATRAELSRLAGHDISRDILGRLKSLGVIAPGPRAPMPGAPIAWVTTARFLKMFALGSLRDLPELDTIDDAGARDRDDGAEAALDDAFGLMEEDAEAGVELDQIEFQR